MSRGVKLLFFLLFEIFKYSTCNFVVYESSDNPVSLPAGSVQIHIFYHIFFFFYIFFNCKYVFQSTVISHYHFKCNLRKLGTARGGRGECFCREQHTTNASKVKTYHDTSRDFLK